MVYVGPNLWEDRSHHINPISNPTPNPPCAAAAATKSGLASSMYPPPFEAAIGCAKSPQQQVIALRQLERLRSLPRSVRSVLHYRPGKLKIIRNF